MAEFTIKIDVGPHWRAWTAGFAGLQAGLVAVGRRAWDEAGRGFYDISQELAHIDTGEMKASGSHELHTSPTELIAELVYGSDHALFEEARGGDHAFISRAWEQAEPRFAAALPEMFEAVVRSWR